MAQRHQSWSHNTLEVWLGYLLTAAAAIPASVIGLFLVRRGAGQQTAVLISVSLAVLSGFIAERVVRLWSRGQRRLVVSMPGFVLVVPNVNARPNATAFSSEPTTSVRASLLLRAA